MRDIDTSLLAAIQQGEIRPFILLNFTLVDDDDNPYTFRYTDCDVSLYFGGEEFEPYPFSVDSVNYSIGKIVDEASVDIDVLDQALTYYFGETGQQGQPI